jgi:L-ascorbate metabolism protein UlaG (beta-lactamase superfamily)
MKFLHARHATSLLTYGGVQILVDPVFSEKEVFPPYPLTPNKRRNPIVSLSTPLETLLAADLVLSTHIHSDHFDDRARELLDKNIPLVCQPEDVKKLNEFGFKQLVPVENNIRLKNISISRVGAQHGTGLIGKMMGPSSGYVLSAENEPVVYFTGDTIYTEAVAENIRKFHPEILIVNAGSPKFLYSDPIVMNIMDLEKTLKVCSGLTYVVVHLETFNHCIEKREDIREYFSPERLANLGVKKFFVPEDNEMLLF